MHEMHLIKDLLADVIRTAQENQIKKVTKVYLRMGQYSEIDPEILRFFFRENGKGTLVEDAEIKIEASPARELRLLSFDGE